MDTSRRGFLALIGALAGTQLGHVVHAEQAKYFVLNDTHVAGFQFHEGPRVLWDMREGEAVKLVAEPDNRHDEWAVRIERHGRHIGYLPRKQNQVVSRLLQQGCKVHGKLVNVDREAAPWRAVKVQAYIKML